MTGEAVVSIDARTEHGNDLLQVPLLYWDVGTENAHDRAAVVKHPQMRCTLVDGRVPALGKLRFECHL